MSDGLRVLRRALIVEDDSGLANALARQLRGREIVAHIAPTLAAAQLVVNDDWDLALIDVRLPDGSGLGLCRTLSERVPRPVLVAISGAATAREGFELARLGVGEFVQKPFEEADLWEAVAKNAGVPLEIAAASAVGTVPLAAAQRTLRRSMIQEALARGGTISDAARLLGVTRQAVQQAIDDFK